jgi:tetratricopeptide (TPR) repeat protein
MRATFACAACLLILLGPAATGAQTETCPSEVPAASPERRARAKEWFGRAERAETAGDPITALKAYQCSLRMVPHAFTAFNLARLAERTGDLELAVESYEAYLKLAPEAPDRSVVGGKIKTLSDRIAELRRAQTPAFPPNPTPPPDSGPPLGQTGLPPDPVPEMMPPPPGPVDSESPPGLVKERQPPHPVVYVLGGVAVGALAGGVMLNLGARSKMDECRRLARQLETEAAMAACDAARPRAYASYALLGLAGAAAVADAVLLLMSTRPSESRISLLPLPDGATFMARLRF